MLSHAWARTSVPIRNIDALSYRRFRYPFFLILGIFLLAWAVYLFYMSPYLFVYTTQPIRLRLEPPAYPLLGAIVSLALYFWLTSASLMIYAGSFRGQLRGSRAQLEAALAIIQL